MTASAFMELEDRPAVVERLFPQAWPALERYARDLAESGELLGLIGPREVSRLWTRHLLNCALVTRVLSPQVTSVADVGSGAGLPGLVLAIVRPEIEFVLVEPMERRTKWLTEEAERLGLSNVTVVRARAEEVSDRLNVDVVTARAVSALATLLPKCVPLLHGCGELALMKGQHVAEEIEKARKVVRKLHLEDIRVEQISADDIPVPTTVVRATMGRGAKAAAKAAAEVAPLSNDTVSIQLPLGSDGVVPRDEGRHEG